jgi:enoyl-CoA hydratase/carnithine racemase
MSDRSVEIERRPVDDAGNLAAIAWLNRPDSLNAIDWEMVHALESGLHEIDEDDRVCAAMIIGRGRAFSAGGDLKSYLTLQRDPVGFPRFLDDLHRAFSLISKVRKPVLALVNGVTAAGGLELLLSCDFAYAATEATIGDLHLNFGQMGGGGVLARLPRAIGTARARELIFSARLLSAEAALDWGLVNEVVAGDRLLDHGLAFAAGVAAKSPVAVANAKRVMNTGFDEGTGLEETLLLEREVNARYCLTMPDTQEGLQAFSEKRSPRFPGRGWEANGSPLLKGSTPPGGKG